MSNKATGLLFIVSAPSGTGKTTLVERLVKVTDRLKLSRSYTSRPPRGDEVNGVDYNFVSRAQFEQMAAAGEFLEWADVFGNLYGTGATDTGRCMESGNDVVLVIDIQGARNVRAIGLPHVAIFVLPPSFEVLEQRLRGRSKDSDDTIRRRLQVARDEVSAFQDYDYVVINDELDSCVERLKGIVRAERSKLSCMRAQALEILRTFSEPRAKD
jgi:guanylate kinase